jgi:hypothetical protein
VERIETVMAHSEIGGWEHFLKVDRKSFSGNIIDLVSVVYWFGLLVASGVVGVIGLVVAKAAV